MTGDLPPNLAADPDLAALQDEVARAAAEAEAAQAKAERAAASDKIDIALTSAKKPKKRKTDRDDDADSIKRAHKRGGMTMALQIGRVYGWRDDEIETLVNPPPPPAPSSSGPVDAAPPDRPGRKSREGGATTTRDGDIVIEDAAGERWTIPKDAVKPLPDTCPVKPLGKMGGEFYYLDPLQQLRAFDAADHSAAGLRDLFGPEITYLTHTWPKFSAQTRRATSFKADSASESLMKACAERGLFDAAEKLRGLGAWRDDDGGLVLHMGDRVLINGAARPPGEYGGRIYPGYAPGPKVAETDAGAFDLFDDLMGRFDSWHWADRDTGARLMDHCWQSYLLFGWLGAAMIGGALDYRPPIWLTADAGAGKSAFLDLVQQVMGDVVKSANATQAYIWSKLGQSTRAVLIDEAESNPSSPRTKNLIELARQAFSGDVIGRGSSDHKAHDFEARSAFMFSSIIIPPFAGQDVSRFAILELLPIEKGGDLRLDPAHNARIGAVMRRRIVDCWGDWPMILQGWRATLSSQGHNSRDCDVFGPMLAMADLLISRGLSPEETRADFCVAFPAAARERASNSEDMLTLLLSKPLDVFRGGTRMTIEDLIATATLIDGTPGETAATPQSCEQALRPWGVFLDHDASGWRVVLPNKNEGLRSLFHGSIWGTDPGSSGGWAQAMKRLPGSRAENSRKYGGRGWSVAARVFLLRDIN